MDSAPENSHLPAADDILLEHDVQRLGRELQSRIKGKSPGVFEAAFWQGLLLDRAMGDPSLKTDLFRLVDALPALSTSEEIARHAREYLLAGDRALPMGLGLALRTTANPLAAQLSAFVIKRNVRAMAERFIIGRDARDARAALQRLWNLGCGFTVDLLGEASVSEAESEIYVRRYADLIEYLPPETARWKPWAILDQGPNGTIPRANISLKLSAMDHLLDPADPDGGVRRLLARVRPLLSRARELGAFINFDLEQWNLHEITYRLFETLAADPEFAAWPHLGIVIQAYLKDAGHDLDRLLALAARRNAPLTVRLVKGAYWDYEVVQSGLTGLPCPVFAQKAETDANYEHLIRRLLEHRDKIHAAFGTHNLRSISVALTCAEKLRLAPGDFELQMLYGMAEPEREMLRGLGHRVRLYAPVGDLITGMAYLVRRLLENTANSSFLRLSHHDHADIGELLARPEIKRPSAATPEPYDGLLTAPFANCALSDFTGAHVREAFAHAVAEAEKQMPWHVPVVINGHARAGGEALHHVSPNLSSRIATTTNSAAVDDVELAVGFARKAWPAWRDLPLKKRAKLTNNLGARLEADRLRLAAMEVHEQGKPWREADADIAEAIDFCRYYARQALSELSPRTQGNLPGEANTFLYEGRGICAVIAPWNFPLAILSGMATAALVAGNAVMLKPAEQATAIAYAFYQHAIAAGVPSEILAFLPGPGEIVGEALVRHRDVVQIAFTGSRDVGLSILKTAAEVTPGQGMIKRVVCEMGGKNAIIIDDDADLDEAITGVIKSAFGYAGQKCSACSRVILVGSIYAPFLTRLKAAAASLAPSSATGPDCLLPPVIDEASFTRLRDILRGPVADAHRVFCGEVKSGGWFVPPAIFEVSDPNHPLMQRELFGPILTVFAAHNFSQALEVANTSDYALTGAVYSRSPRRLEQATREFRVGNLYLNRPCTGAMVNRQPFGGFKMSGAGTKAGGPGYLLNFAEMRLCTENTMRRGFTPEIL
ncbi:MAG TPA: proline dehydrogenase family protein [Candidatus Methylacidiphilales bacterium]|jgi:RHH-type proline utilization regulon transcriptional repressor/proline dehydrogenase/delta 1-pyrroline-5-carboxylate dehydrogenase|nr:proline dehydrogenase family protein [Candidatus Methylacidiphilales bacterium]